MKVGIEHALAVVHKRRIRVRHGPGFLDFTGVFQKLHCLTGIKKIPVMAPYLSKETLHLFRDIAITTGNQVSAAANFIYHIVMPFNFQTFAVETRPKTAILLAGGLIGGGRPESNPVNYVPRITMPILMLVGRYDTFVRHETWAKPMLDLIGTADDHKVMKVYETDHIPPKSDYIAEILAWLDRYLGPPGDTGKVTTGTVEQAGPSP